MKSGVALNLIVQIMTGVLKYCHIAALVAFGGLLFSGVCDGETLLSCPAWPGRSEGVRSVEGATIRIEGATESVDGKTRGGCQILITNETGRTLFFRRERAITLEPISGTDLNGDGLPDIVVRSEADFRYTYFFISPKADPPVFKTLENGYGIRFERLDDGRVLLVVPDDGFQGLPDLLDIYHYESVVPEIRFVLNGYYLKDVTSTFGSRYDKEIKKAQSALSRDDMAAFKDGEIKDSFHRNLVKGKVLTIALSYLYSGREKQAWQVLDKMWPQEERTRIRQVLVNARAKGSLRLLQE